MPELKLRCVPQLRALESRELPAVFIVNGLTDANSGSGNVGDLRYCLTLANSDKTSADTITFDAALFNTGQTIKLANGVLNIQGPTVINGPGPDLLTIDAAALSGVFKVDNGSSSQTPVALYGMRLVNGDKAFDGGAVLIANESLTLNSVWIENCRTTSFGSGGAIYSGLGSKLEIINSTISGNTGAVGGAIYISGNGYLLIRNSTISGNKSGTDDAGALGVISGTTTRIENPSITGNHSAGDGGGIWLRSDAGPITIESSIIAGNIADTGIGADISGQTVTATNCFIGVGDSGFTLNKQGTTIAGTKASPANPQLGPLQNNGGPMPTHMPSAASTVRDLGSNPSGLQYDQRGDGFPRSLQGGVDIGAVESISNNPTATMKGLGPISISNSTPNTIEVTYKDSTAINWATINVGDIQILNPNAVPLTITGVTVDAKSSGPIRVATYTFAVPGGSWDLPDNGTYNVNMLANQVYNTSALSVVASKLGEFNVSFGTSFLVTNTADSGPGSLRQAIMDANASMTVGADTITFAPGVAGTITANSDLVVTDSVEIAGPGAGTLALTRTKGGHIFLTTNSITFTLAGLTLRDTDPTNASPSMSGTAVLSAGNLTIRDCIVSGNGTVNSGPSSNGGAISHSGTLLLERSTFTNNKVVGVGGAVSAGPIVTIRQCTFNGNAELGSISGAAAGGAVYATGTVTIDDSTFSSNVGDNARTSGGALGISGNVLIRNSTFYGNSANDGGAIYVASGTTTLQNCTVTGNTAYDGPLYTGYGGGIISGGTLQLQSTIVSNNIDADAPDLRAFGTVTADHSAIGSLTGITTYIDNGNNLAPGTNLNLGSFDNNGGLTKTIPLSAGSPAINAGSNPGSALYDQRGVGFNRGIGKSADIGAFEYQSVPAVITGIKVGDGTAQRSLVKSLTISFDRNVSASASSFKLERQLGGVVTLNASVSGTDVTLTFTGGPLEFGSLADGRYTLTAIASSINGGAFDGNGDQTPGDDYVLVGSPSNGLFRLFGDSDGNGVTNAVDFAAFRGVFGLGASMFDFNNDGVANAADFAQFRARFGMMV